eukprot:PhM_4_TR9812/c0_g1_i1/m.21873/K11838/USP7, UBP15; ubiquitin carboxyl-terminal hydrolase 7
MVSFKSFEDLHREIRVSGEYTAVRGLSLPPVCAYHESGVSDVDALLRLSTSARQTLFTSLGLNVQTKMVLTHCCQQKARSTYSYRHLLKTPDRDAPCGIAEAAGVYLPNPYDSASVRSLHGHVGLRNQGSTCYLNAFLQMLYHMTCFRTALYRLPAPAQQSPDEAVGIILALQRLFYKLEHGETAVDTMELTKSFGWSASDSFIQHDTHEFASKLLDKLDDKFREAGLPHTRTILDLFGGKTVSYVSCLNVEHTVVACRNVC